MRVLVKVLSVVSSDDDWRHDARSFFTRFHVTEHVDDIVVVMLLRERYSARALSFVTLTKRSCFNKESSHRSFAVTRQVIELRVFCLPNVYVWKYIHQTFRFTYASGMTYRDFLSLSATRDSSLEPSIFQSDKNSWKRPFSQVSFKIVTRSLCIFRNMRNISCV